MPFRDPRRLFAVSIVQALRLSIWAFEGVMTEIRELVGARQCWKTVEVVLPVTLSNWAQDLENPKTWRWNRPMTVKRRWVAVKSKYQPNSQLLSAEDFRCHFSKVCYRWLGVLLRPLTTCSTQVLSPFWCFRASSTEALSSVFSGRSSRDHLETAKQLKRKSWWKMPWTPVCCDMYCVFLCFPFGELGSLIFVGREPWYLRTYGYGFEVAHELEVGCSGNGHF